MSSRRERLAQIRRQAGHTQQSLATALDVSRRTVLRWEDGSADPHPTQRTSLAAALNVSMHELADLLSPRSHTPDGPRDTRVQTSRAAAGRAAETQGPVGTEESAETAVQENDGLAAKRWTDHWTRRRTGLIRLAAGALVVAAALFIIVRAVGTSPASATADTAASTPLVALHSGKCVSITGDVFAEGARLQQRPCTGEVGRTWRFERLGHNSAGPAVFHIVSVDSRFCVTISDQHLGGTLLILQQTCDPASGRQQWRFVESQPQQTGDSYGQFINMQRGECLDINGATVADDALVVAFTCGNALHRNQLFGVMGEARSSLS